MSMTESIRDSTDSSDSGADADSPNVQSSITPGEVESGKKQNLTK